MAPPAPPPPGPGGPNLAQSGMPWPGKPKGGGKPLQPPGASGAIASLVINPDFFTKDADTRRAKHWWSPGKDRSTMYHFRKVLFKSSLRKYIFYENNQNDGLFIWTKYVVLIWSGSSSSLMGI